MTGNQIVGGNLSYPKTTRNAVHQNQHMAFNSQMDPGSHQGDNSLIMAGQMAGNKTNADRSVIGGMSDSSVKEPTIQQSFLLGSDNKGDVSQNITNLGQSQTTQETSKQVFGGGGKHQLFSPSSIGQGSQSVRGGPVGKPTDASILMGNEL